MISNRDPLQGLIDYINEVKPFHTKIAEIRVQYEYEDVVNVTISDRLQFQIDIKWYEQIAPSFSESFYFIVDELFQNDTVTITIADNTSNNVWDVPAWGLGGWSYPVPPFIQITQNLFDIIDTIPIDQLFWPLNGPLPQDGGVATQSGNTVGVSIQDQIQFIGAAQPTLYLTDTIGVTVLETAGIIAGTSSGTFIGSWDYPYWDIGGFDEDMNTLINLYGEAFPPSGP